MKSAKNYIICLYLLIQYLLNGCQSEPNVYIEIKRISDRVVVFSCLDVNVSAIVSRKGIIIIDTNRSPGIMKEIKEEIENIFGRNDIINIINTHGHWDHCSGNQVFNEVNIIGHKNCVEHINHNKSNSPINIWSLNRRISRMEKDVTNPDRNEAELTEIKSNITGWNLVKQDLINKYRPTPPTTTFLDSLTLDLGDLTLRMIYCGNAHTNNDIFIFIPEEKLVFTGDMFISENRFGFSINKLVDVQRIITSMDIITNELNEIEFIIPGHGELFSGNAWDELKKILIKKNNKISNKKSVVKYLEDMLNEYEPPVTLKKYFLPKSLNKDSNYYWLEDEFNVLGRRYMAMGMIDRAILVFKMEVESFPKSALSYDNLGEAYLVKEELKLAIENYEKSLMIYSDNKNAQDKLEYLRNNNF